MTEKPHRVTQTWREADGDKTVALDWPIDQSSIVFEIGAYEGRWASQMAEKYNPRLYAFEPQPWAFERAKPKLEGYNARIYNFGLWTHDCTAVLGDYGRDGASLVKPWHQDQFHAKLVDIYGFINENLTPDERISVCLINIEGGEFALIPYMIGLGITDRIDNLFVQFHYFAPLGKEKEVMIRERLATTHSVLWDFSPTAVCWRIK